MAATNLTDSVKAFQHLRQLFVMATTLDPDELAGGLPGSSAVLNGDHFEPEKPRDWLGPIRLAIQTDDGLKQTIEFLSSPSTLWELHQDAVKAILPFMVGICDRRLAKPPRLELWLDVIGNYDVLEAFRRTTLRHAEDYDISQLDDIIEYERDRYDGLPTRWDGRMISVYTPL